LSRRKDKDSIAKLKRALNEDPFYGVRLEASMALRSAHSDDALEALLASTKQSDARVRRQVMSDIGSFYRDTAYECAKTSLATEKNPEILASAIQSMGGYAKPEVHDTVLKYLRSESYRNELANAAIATMRSQDDPAYITPLMEALIQTGTNFTTQGFAQGLSALAYLARKEESRDKVREFLAGYVNDKRKTVKLASINALGTLGDPKALPIVEKFATAAKDSPERTAAEKVVADLRADRKPVDDFKNLRQEVTDLQKSDRELRKELEDLKKKLEAKETASSSAARPKKKPVLPPKH
jgi:aminopeptidase N